MANPFYNNYASQNRPNQNFQNNPSSNMKDLYNVLSKSNNPVELFKNIAKNNPNMKPIINLLDKGYSPQQVFNSICEQRGINPQEFIKSLRN